MARAIQQPVTPVEPQLQAIKFSMVNRGGVALIKLPHRSDTAEFAVAARSIRNFCDEFQVTCLLFGSEQDFECLVLDQAGLERLGLQRSGAK